MEKSNRQRRIERDVKSLMRANGFAMYGNRLVALGIPGFSSDRIMRKCRDLFDAAESLIPLINEAAYANALRRIYA